MLASRKPVQRLLLSQWFRSLTCKALVYKANGKPSDVVKLIDQPVPEVGPRDVSVDMLMCPVNPVDINTIQGVYGIQPPLPAVGGSEGVGVVTRVGAEVDSIVEGDWVIPAITGLGTWQTTIVSDARDFLKISKAIPLHLAATLSINPSTAYRMLKDFVSLQPGDCVIQNGANSGVGQSIIQLAAAWGLHSINIIRNRVNTSAAVSYLKGLGATEVITTSDSGMFGDTMSKLFDVHGRPKIGFNCVGGRNAAQLLKHLAPGATMVTYGGMSLKPLTVGTGTLIFKDLHIRGYWNSRWLKKNVHGEEHVRMMSELCALGEEGKLRPPQCVEYSLTEDSYQAALDRAMEPFIGTKQMLVMQH